MASVRKYLVTQTLAAAEILKILPEYLITTSPRTKLEGKKDGSPRHQKSIDKVVVY